MKINEYFGVYLSFQVKSQEQAAVYFPIIPSEVGSIDIEVSARSTLAADAVRRQLIVEVCAFNPT